MYKKWVRVFLVFLIISSNFSFVTSAQGTIEQETVDNSSDWTLVWSDEFDGTELDTTKWTHDTGNGFVGADGTYVGGWGNNELQTYQEGNVSVDGEHLILQAREEEVTDDYGTYDYTSGKITTRGKFSQKYGRFEARMKLPEGQGYWPAFWMMPEDDVYGGWAASGEIDIMENAGVNLDHIGGAIHYGGQWPNNTYTAKDYHFPADRNITDFNVYAVEWEPGEIRWYVNDELYQTLNNWSTTSDGNPAKFSYPAPFDQEFFLILNLAIGGWYGGGPNESTPIPGEVLVDYVRAYELTGREYKEPVEPVFEPEDLPAGAKDAIDGNYVYDPTYANGFTTITGSESETWDNEFWNLVYMNDFNGSASATVDEINGEPFAKVDIAQAGNQPYSVQLIQNVTVGKGRWYKLSFDAKSTADRNLSVKIGGGPERGYAGYSPNTDFGLTNELQSYELVFQMQQDSDALARLELNMGLNTNSVWIGNVKLEEVTAVDPYNEQDPKEPLKNGNHVYNGTFDQGNIDRLTYWNLLTEGVTATASVDPDAREVAVAITDGGTSSDAVKLVQTGMNLLPNDEYKVSFDARAAEGRDIEVAVLSKDGSVNYSNNQVISLTTEMTTQEMTFTMSNVEDIEGQLVFLLGGNSSDVVIDNVKMIRTTNNNAGVTLEEAFPLKNGDFSNGIDGWGKHVQGDHEPGTSDATIEVLDGEVKASFATEGWEPWHVLFMQNGMKFSANQTYVLEFDARSTVDRKVEVVVENATYNRYFSDVIDLTNTMKTFTYEFEMSADDTVDLKYLLGKVVNSEDIGSHEVFIDNVKLEVKGEREKYFPLTNGDFSAGIENWGDYVHNDGANASVVAEDGKAKVAVAHTGNEAWSVQFTQDNLALEEGHTYIVEFDASTSMDRGLEFSIENAGYHRYADDIVQLTEELQTFSYEFEMSNTDTVAFKFLLGAVDGVVIGDAHDIFIDNVRLEVKGAREVLSGTQGEEQPEEPTEPEEPTDPSEKEWKEVGENLIVDGSFDTITEFGNAENPLLWNLHNQADYEEWAGLADFSVIDGVLNAEVKQVGWDWWHIQLFQNVEVPVGTYKVAFDMQSDLERIARLDLEGIGIQEFTVGNTIETYETFIEVTEAGEFKFMFGLGRAAADEELTAPYTILIDNVRLVEVEEVIVTDPVTPAPAPQPETPVEEVVVNNPQADNSGKVSVVIGQGDKVVKLPAQAEAINRNNKVNIERDDFSMEVPGAVLESLKDLGKDDSNSKISVSFEKQEKEVIESSLVKHGAAKKAGIRSAGDIFEFNLSVVGTNGEAKKLSSFEEPVRVKLKISDGADLDLVGIYRVEEDGQLTYVGGDVDGQTISTDLYSFSKYAVLEYDKSYEDVAADYWAHDTIKKLSARHIMTGYTNGDFAPRKDVTRAEFASMLVRALSLKTEEAVTFNDVADTDWYAKDIAAAYEAGLIAGVGNQKFAPEEVITREQMTAMIVRAYEIVNGPIENTDGTNNFTDGHAVSSWAKGYVNQAATLNLVQGKGNGMFSPLVTANRAEGAQIIYNLLFN